METSYTEDLILGGRIRVFQPRKGYRVAIDPIMLAASIEAKPSDTILDVGAGIGAVSLCLAARLSSVRIIGLELQNELASLFHQNVQRNDLSNFIEVLRGDLRSPPDCLVENSFSQVVMNPPYFKTLTTSSSPVVSKTFSHQEWGATLEQWIQFGLAMLKPKGCLTLIHRPDRLGNILQWMGSNLGEIEIYPLWSRANQPAGRVLIRGKKTSQGPLKIYSGLIIHDANGSNTKEAELILRHASSISWRNDSAI
jgi:tRNA1(Val) A37 N6-methylase TrmN6